jgi:hypothetical protein
MKTLKILPAFLALLGILAIGFHSTSVAAAEKKEGAKMEKVEAADLPAAVKTALEKEVGSGTDAKYMKGAGKDGKTTFMAHWKDGDKMYMASAAEDGTIIKAKMEAPAKKKKAE